MRVAFLVSMGNWSVSQPRSGEPVLASMEPSIPSLCREGDSEQVEGRRDRWLAYLEDTTTSCS